VFSGSGIKSGISEAAAEAQAALTFHLLLPVLAPAALFRELFPFRLPLFFSFLVGVVVLPYRLL
jgi:hypothetical protein